MAVMAKPKQSKNGPNAVLFGLLAAAVLLAPSLVHAQERHQFTLEASVFRGTLGYARAVSPAVHVGGEVGFGFPQIDYTLSPAGGGDPSFEEYLHVALFVRQRLHTRVSYDVGVRAAMADLWSCTVSDCLPAPFLGGYVQPMFGGRRFSIGPRIVAGWTAEAEDRGNSTFTIAVAPLNVRLTLGR